jgi:hypothetical protein
MRWLFPILGTFALTGGFYMALAPRVFRPVLRVALELEPGNPDDDARAAGLALAIEDREERAGRWRLATAHQTRQPNGALVFPKPRAHTMIHGLEAPHTLPGPEGPLLRVHGKAGETFLSTWMKARGLERLAEFGPDYNSNYASLGAGPPNPRALQRANEVIQARPEVVVLYGWLGPGPEEFKALRAAGFSGPVFLGMGWISTPSLGGFEGALIILSPLMPVPPEFQRRHPHPFAYTAYRGALTYFDALDAERQADPLDLARNLWGGSVFDLYRDEPRVYEVRNGRLEPSK